MYMQYMNLKFVLKWFVSVSSFENNAIKCAQVLCLFADSTCFDMLYLMQWYSYIIRLKLCVRRWWRSWFELLTGPLYVYLFVKAISLVSRCTCWLCWRWYTACSLKLSQADWEMWSHPGTCKRAVDEADKGLDCLAVIRTRWARGPHTSLLSSMRAGGFTAGWPLTGTETRGALQLTVRAGDLIKSFSLCTVRCY